jgi:hypothetical protein
LTNKNVRVKEQTLITILKFCENQDNSQIIIQTNSICNKIVPLLLDPQLTVRQIAMEVVVKLYEFYGENLMVRNRLFFY